MQTHACNKYINSEKDMPEREKRKKRRNNGEDSNKYEQKNRKGGNGKVGWKLGRKNTGYPLSTHTHTGKYDLVV